MERPLGLFSRLPAVTVQQYVTLTEGVFLCGRLELMNWPDTCSGR